MATTDTERYVRVNLLTFKGGIWISKKIICREVDGTTGTPTLTAVLQSKKPLLNQKRNHREITRKQFEILFPPNGDDTDIDKWDLSLLVKMIRILFGPGLPGIEKFHLNELLTVRNEVMCHIRDPAITEQEFQSIWTQLRTSLGTLASSFDADSIQCVSDMIRELSKGPLDLKSSVEKLAQLCRHEEHMENVLASLSRLGRRQDKIATGVVSANHKLDGSMETPLSLSASEQPEQHGPQELSVSPGSPGSAESPRLTTSVTTASIQESQVQQQTAQNQAMPHVPGAPGGPGQAPDGQPSAADPEKRKLILQQLVVLLHAHRCQRREQNNGEACSLPHCRTMKNVLNHMTTCNAGTSCLVAHCVSSRQILTHWKNCTIQDCPVCLPIKRALDRQKQPGRQPANTAGTTGPPSSVNTTGPPAVPPGMTDAQLQKAYAVLGLPYNGKQTGLQSNPNQALMNNQVEELTDELTSDLPFTVNMNLNAGQNRGRLLGNQSIPLTSRLSAGTGGDGLQIIAQTTRGTKEWHQSVTQDLRNHLVYKLVQAIFPIPDPAVLKDRRVNNLVAYFRKVEGDMYETANSREEYYHFLAEKIYNIQKEMEEKRLERRKTQQKIGGPGDPPTLDIRPPSSLGNDLLGGRSTLNGPLSNPLSGLPGAGSDPFGQGNAQGLGAPNMPPRMPAMQPPHPRTTSPLTQSSQLQAQWSKLESSKRTLSGDEEKLITKRPKKSDLPDGLSTLDPKWTELYLQALREGKEKQRNIRVMIVGHEGVGKTTLARNLMNKPIQGVETTNGIEVHVRTVLVEVDGTWKESDTASKYAEVGERIARIIEPANEKAKHAETDNIQKEISPPELIYPRTSYPSSADAITEASTLIVEIELPQDSEKALDTNIPTQVSIPHEVIKKDLSITGQTMVKQLMMVNEKQHDTNPDTTVSVWDFGGQFIFYATHQIFLSSEAIYLLVLDLSKGFDDMIDDGCPITCSGAKRRTVQDFIKFWMHSIHTFASSETGEPPVILVGTHRDKIDEQEISKEDHAENYFENIRKLFDKTPLLHHIQPQHFFLDNLGPEKNSFTKLRSRVMATAAEQSSFNKEIPAKWIPLEQALFQIENKPYITFSEVLEMDSKSDVPIADVEVIRLFLMHHHFQGLLVYFNEEELQDYIILKPQWIIDAFKCIITSWRVFNKKPHLREMWQDFENTAVLKNNLIEEVWQRNDEADFLADKELLLKFLVRLGIMSRGRAYDEDTGKVEELDNFLVPSFLPVQRDESDMETLLVNATPTQMVIVFKFEHSYIYPTEHSYISPTIYHRITAAAVGKWPVVDDGTQLLYGNIGMYRLDTPHVGIVRLTDRSIELSVHNLCGKSVDCDIADSFRRFIKRAIKQELSRFHCGKETQITTTFRCSCSKRGTEKEHVNTEELKGNDSLPCPVKLSGHIINGRRSYREWFFDADAFVQIDSQVLQKKLGDREIGRISKAIGLNWQLLGMDLGIPMVELERIQMDHPYSSAVQIRYMLQTWKERAVGEATMQALYDKMKDNPEVSIDWDKIKDMIDILCETEVK